MKRKTPVSLLSALVAFALFPLSSVHAADHDASASERGIGTLTGRVYDDATGKSLQGAIVRIVGSPASDYTDADGRFTIPSVPAGSRTVEVEYVGLDQIRQTVNLTAGTTRVMDVGLTSEVLRMQPFEVAESARGQALAINQQRTASGILNIISEEAFGAIGDGNIGNALKRLPGLTVDEDSDGGPNSVNIRGLSDDFNSFQLDGNRIGSRGFNMRHLAADGIATIEVIKAVTPDRDGDAIGGIINVKSRSAFQRDSRELKLSGAGTYLDLRDEWGYNVRGTYSDIYSVFGKEKSLGVSVTLSKYTTIRSYDILNTDWAVLTKANNPGYDLWDETVMYAENLTAQTNDRKTWTKGLNASIDFRVDDRHSFYLRPTYTSYETWRRHGRARAFPDSKHKDELTGDKTLDPAGLTATTVQSGLKSEGEIRFHGEQEDTNNHLRAITFGGKHEFASSTLTHDFYYSFLHFARDTHSDYVVRHGGPDKAGSIGAGFQMLADYSERLYPKVDVFYGDPYDLTRIKQGTLKRQLDKDRTWAYSGKVDWEKSFISERVASKLKLGAKYRANEPQRDRTQFEYKTVGKLGPAFYGQFMTPTDQVVLGRPMYLTFDMDKVYELLAAMPEVFQLDEIKSTTGGIDKDHKSKEETSAAYSQYSMQVGRHTILGGVRVERIGWESHRQIIDQGTMMVSPVLNSREYTLWLPGLHLRHELQPNLVLRESVNQTYGRPTLQSLTNSRIINAEGDVEDGNPDLEPTDSTNFDIQLEYYTKNFGLYSIGFFYKEMKGFYYNRILAFNDFDGSGNPIPLPTSENGLYEWERPEMGEGGQNYGVELIARQKLGFLPSPFSGLGVSLSATFSESDVIYPGRGGEDLPTPGFSKSMFNASLEYSHQRFQAVVRYRYRTSFMGSLGKDLYSDNWFSAREQVDMEASYRVSDRLKIYGDVDNLTKRPLVSYQGNQPNMHIASTSVFGWRATMGVEFSF